MPISTIGSNSLNATSDLVINGVTVGRGTGSVSTNTAVGASALNSNTTGAYNTAVGYTAGYSNSTGTNNAYFGRAAGYGNTASNNTAIGDGALSTAGAGGNNTALGSAALSANTSGNFNTALGTYALISNTTASNNTAVGYQSLNSNTTANWSTAVGYQTLYNSNRTADVNASNSAFGYQAGYGVTTGNLNTFLGNNSGSAVTTGSANTILGSYNGNQGGLDIRTASNYIVLSDGNGNPRAYWDGSGTGYSNSTSSNAFNIQYSGAWSSGNANFITMYMSGMTGGTAGLALGKSGSTYNTTKIIFGYAGSGSTSNYLGLGFWDADARLTIYPTGNATLTGSLTQNSSDERLKTNISIIESALSKVCSLRGFTYNWNELAAELNLFKTDVREVGVSAQEVQAVLPEAVFIAPFDQKKGDARVSESGENYLTVQYEKLTPLLIEAIKELKADLDATKAELSALKGQA